MMVRKLGFGFGFFLVVFFGVGVLFSLLLVGWLFFSKDLHELWILKCFRNMVLLQ